MGLFINNVDGLEGEGNLAICQLYCINLSTKGDKKPQNPVDIVYEWPHFVEETHMDTIGESFLTLMFYDILDDWIL